LNLDLLPLIASFLVVDIHISILDSATRLMCALLFGFMIGWERETKRKPAGLRTQMLVALGSAAFTLIALQLFNAILQDKGRINVDPMRILNGIMEGLGFLGAGCIIQSRGSVEGITTAATIWVVGAVGLACGAGNYYLAAVTTFFAFIVLTAFRLFEGRLLKSKN
jgi:putative Mg2+ transporter-C (MgtC) family protein